MFIDPSVDAPVINYNDHGENAENEGKYQRLVFQTSDKEHLPGTSGQLGPHLRLTSHLVCISTN